MALPRPTSDHCPIVLNTCEDSRSVGKKFRFKEVWLKFEDFRANVAVW